MTQPREPWWASGQPADGGIDRRDPLDAHRRARGATAGDPPDPGAEDGNTGPGPHAEGEVCDACPICLGLRALRGSRPDVVAHLADAAHHLSLALRAFADAQDHRADGVEHIDLDP